MYYSKHSEPAQLILLLTLLSLWSLNRRKHRRRR
ncbi:MAG: PEP-CTERM sorting domain-containing protein [Planctomycetes bacterium]|nr:PEP-CTERM sorting domain-containing protein [Planctomycetota bacterium]